MSSKRKQRRAAERRERERRERENSGGLSGGLSTAVIRDGIGSRTNSFADLILRRTTLLQDNAKQEKKAEGKPEMPEPKVTTPAVAVAPVVAPSSSDAETETQALLSQSHHQKERIWKAAEENAAYYLRRQAEDASRTGTTGKPWFMYPRYDYQYSEFVMISPLMARTMLDHLWAKDEGNRNKKPALVDAYKRDIVNDRWIPTDEAIGVNLSMEVYNGQHRLWAIFESGKAMPIYVTWNVLDEAKFFIESGAIRSLSERLQMVVDPKLGNRTSGFCKAMMRGLSPRVKFTNADIAEFAYKWDSVLQWVAQHYPIGRAEVQAAIAKAYLWYGPEKIEPFAKRLREIKFPDDGDPAKALYVSLQHAKQNRSNVALVAYKKTLQAIDALMDGRSLLKVYERSEDIFEWGPGWELPPKPQPKK